MTRLTPWSGPEPLARRGLRFRDIVRAAVVLAALLAVAIYVVDRQPQAVAGAATAVDGDSLRVAGVSIRLEGVDAPELQQLCEAAGGQSYPCGDGARRELARVVNGTTVVCRIVGEDKYRRSLARCEADGEDIGASLVRKGYAVAYGKTYAREEMQAKRERAGLWGGRFRMPEEWRREHRPLS
jgi:endonuclease YncB( thermonuclease family)